VPASERRAQLLHVASQLLEQGGLEAVQITQLAVHAGVSRPLVYRLFPTRQALVQAVLEDFTSALDARFRQALLERLPRSLEEVTRAFVVSCFDTIEERGRGAWYLLDRRGPDTELGRLGASIAARLVEPWIPQVAALTGLSQRRARVLIGVVEAAGKAMLQGWLEGALGREQALRDTTRAVSALLSAFTGA
jgi:AcrR family transcriptional regulator